MVTSSLFDEIVHLVIVSPPKCSLRRDDILIFDSVGKALPLLLGNMFKLKDPPHAGVDIFDEFFVVPEINKRTFVALIIFMPAQKAVVDF